MGEGLKLRKRQVEKSKEKLQSLEFVSLPQELKNEIKSTPATTESGRLLHELLAATTCAHQVQALKKCAAALQKALSSPTNNTDQAALTAIAFIKILFSSPNPTINSIVVSFLNAIHSQSLSTSLPRISQTLIQQTENFVHHLHPSTPLPATTLPHLASDSFRLAVLSSILEIQLARDAIDGSVPQILSYVSSLLERHASYFVNAGTQSLADAAGECDIALRVLLMLLMKFSNAVGKVTERWLKGEHGSSVPSLFSSFINLLSCPATPRSCFTHIGVAFAQFLFLCGGPATVQRELENMMEFGFEGSPETSTSVLDHALPKAFLITFAHLSTMAKLALLRGIVFIKGAHAANILFGKLPKKENYNLVTDYVFARAVQMTLNGGEQHSMIMGLQCVHGLLQRLMAVITDPTIFSPEFVEGAIAPPDKAYLVQQAAQIGQPALHLAWTTWDSPIPSIPYHANLVFEALLDLVDACGESSALTFHSIASRLLDVDWHQKGKYAPLLALLERLGANQLLNVKGNFIPDMLTAVGDHGVCNSIKQLLEQFLMSIRNQTIGKETDSSKISSDQFDRCYSFWMDSLVSLIVGSSDVVSDHTSVYLLPVVLKHFPESLKIILSKVEFSANSKPAVLESSSNSNGGFELNMGRIRGVLSVLKSARQMGLVDGIMLASDSSGFFGDLKFSDLLSLAMGHRDIQLRLSALELVCVSARQTEFPTRTELAAVKTFLTANAKGAPPHVRFSTLGYITKLWLRTKEGGARKMRLRTPATGDEATDSDIVAFLNWICAMCIASLYPGSPFSRKILPLELYSLMVDVWQVDEAEKNAPSYSPYIQKYLDVILPQITIFDEKNTTILLNGLWDRYDRCRQLANDILLKFPTPLPGFGTPEKARELVDWGWSLVQSPKSRECDTGAYVMRLVLCKYVVQGWDFVALISGSCGQIKETLPSDTSKRIASVIRFLVTELKRHVESATKDMQYASRHTPMHGILLTLRHLICELNYTTSPSPTSVPARKDKGTGGTNEITARINVDVSGNIEEWRVVISELLDFATRASLAALHIVADIAPEGYTPKANVEKEVEATPVAYFSPGMYENDEEFPDDEEGDDSELTEGKDLEYTSPAGQLITVCSWLTIKQVSLLLGHIVYRFPFSDASQVSGAAPTLSLKIDQIQSIGQLLMRILLTTRHKGAIEKTYIGFQMLCERLLRCNETALFGLPSKWIEQLFVLVNDNSREITRRSAGLPYGFTAVLCAEASHTRTTAAILLPSVMRSLLALANSDKDGPTMPRIHAINILRAIFKTKALTHAIDPYLSDTLMAVVDAYTSPNWSIRNSAMMAYSVLLDKCVSLRRVRDEKTPLNTTTFTQFFSRYPPLYGFLLTHMETSLADLSKLSHVHTTSVYAILLLLSRLYPSLHDHAETSDPKAPNSEGPSSESKSKPADASKSSTMSSLPFIPLIQKCTRLPNSLVRYMASQALVPLIPTTRVYNFIHALLTSKPHNQNEAHGMLLQTLMLVKGHQYGMNPVQKSELLNIMPLLLPNLRFVGTNKIQIPFDPTFPSSTYADATPCGALAAVALEIALLLCFHLSSPSPASYPLPSSPSSALSPFITFSRHVLTSEGFPRVVLWQSEMLVQAALLSAHAATAQDAGDAADVIAQLLRHPTYDVRQVVLKLMSQWRKANSPAASLLYHQSVYSTISELVQNEMHPKSLLRSVKLMIHASQSAANPSPTHIHPFSPIHTHSSFTHLHLWPRVRELLADHAGPLRLCAVQILARLFVDVSDMLIASQSSEHTSTVCAKWVDVIDECSSPSSELDLRTTVVESLKATSKYLSSSRGSLPPNSTVENCVVRMWIVVIRLLEDDDESIREKAAQLVSQTATLDSRSTTQRSALMVSRALECAFATLTHNFGHSQIYIDFLFGCIDDLAPDSKEEGIGKVSGTRVLFDQEDTNAYVEELTNVQLAVAQLQKLLRSPPTHPNPSLLQKLPHLLSRMATRIHLSTQQLSQLHEPTSTSLPLPPSVTPPPPPTSSSSSKQKGSLLLRWVTYEKDVFIPLYRAALSLASLSSFSPIPPLLVPPPTSSIPPSQTKTINKEEKEEGRESERDMHPLVLHALATSSDDLIAGLSLFFLTSV